MGGRADSCRRRQFFFAAGFAAVERSGGLRSGGRSGLSGARGLVGDGARLRRSARQSRSDSDGGVGGGYGGSIDPGNRNTKVALFKQLLRKRGYHVGSGKKYDSGTSRAVMAFRKVNNMSRSFNATPEIFRRLAEASPRVRVETIGTTEEGREILLAIVSSEANLDRLDWSESTKAAQRNWIGRSEGAEITFRVQDIMAIAGAAAVPASTAEMTVSETDIRVFTTRPDTIFGATYLVLAPEHPLVDRITTDDERAGVREYREATARQDAAGTRLAADRGGKGARE